MFDSILFQILLGIASAVFCVTGIMYFFIKIGNVEFKKTKTQKIEVSVFSEEEDPSNEKNFSNFVIAMTDWEECSEKMSKEEMISALENARNDMTFDFFSSPFYKKGILALYDPRQFYSDLLDRVYDEGRVKFK